MMLVQRLLVHGCVVAAACGEGARRSAAIRLSSSITVVSRFPHLELRMRGIFSHGRVLGRPLVLAAVAIVLAACGDGPSEPVDPVAAASGAYDLASVDGDAVPSLIVAPGAEEAEIIGGTVILKSNGSLTQTVDYRAVVNGVTEEGTAVYLATWSLVGSTGLYIEWDDYAPVEGTISGGALTFDDLGGTHVYRRR